MVLSWIRTLGFRNLTPARIRLTDGVNAFMGYNAQGKTNILEAVSLLANGRSFRGARMAEIIQTGQSEAAVEGQVRKEDMDYVLKIHMNRTTRQYHLDDKPVNDLRDFLGMFSYVVFSAESMAIVDGDPAARRNFLDHGFFSITPSYLLTLRSYRKALKSRNATIKRSPDNTVLIQTWDEPLSRYGAVMIHSRLNYLNRIIPEADAAHRALSAGAERLDIAYCSQWLPDDVALSDDVRRIENHLREVLVRELGTDIRRGATMSGPHRDDLKIGINGNDIRQYGSRGQKRTALMALKLSELAIFKESRHEYPVLILDDMASEFDEARQAKMIQVFPEKIQILISHTDVLNGHFDRPVRYYHVADGCVSCCP